MRAAFRGSFVAAIAALVTLLGGSGAAQASLATFTGSTFVGHFGVSTDGFASNSGEGSIQAFVPSGAVVEKAFLYSATNNTSSVPTIQLGGNLVTLGPAVPNSTDCCNLISYRADVTSLVKPLIDAGGGAANGFGSLTYNFAIKECGGAGACGFDSTIDGESLIVVYSNPSLPTATVGILDGFSAVGGDSTSINFATPLHPAAPGFFAEMRIGDSFSCNEQRSTIKVNGTTITNEAGNFDDSDTPPPSSCSNGELFTMGGDDDPFSPLLPAYAQDHERYNLVPLIVDGDTTISINTNNPSADDNIFVAVFFTSGEAGVNAPPPNNGPSVPEPSTLLLLGSGIVALAAAARRRQGGK